MFDTLLQQPKNRVRPLAISRSAPQELGQLTCLGIYRNAINFSTPQQALLTLHRFGKGLTPSGWLLKRADFDHIAYLMQLQLPIYLIEEGIYCNGITITQQQIRKIPLTIQSVPQTHPVPLHTIIQNYDHPTGLHGKLATVDLSGNNPRLQKYHHFLLALQQRQLAEYSLLLGEGPGLTPSSDDILIGILAYSFTQPELNQHLIKLLSPLRQLNHLTRYTTLISSYFISQASAGLFATPILHLLNSQSNHAKLRIHVEKLLNYGHTSGADILIGLGLAEASFTKR